MKLLFWVHNENNIAARCDPYDPNVAAMLGAAPQRRWIPVTTGTSGGYWIYPITEPNMQHIATMVSRYGDAVELGEGVSVFLAHALLQARAMDIKAKRISEYTFSHEAPPILDYKFKTTPFKHQIVGFDACRNEDKFALFMEMGTGKTKVVVDRACYGLSQKCGFDAAIAASALPAPEDTSDAANLERRTRIFKLLVIAPKSILHNWGREFTTHATLPFAFGVMSGGAGDRIEAIKEVMTAPQRLKVVAINYDAVAKWGQILGICGWDLVVADESTRIKTPGRKRTQATIDIASKVPNRMILTGQPITKNVLDLYSQCEFLAPGEGVLGYTSFAAFTRRYTEADPYVPQRRVPRNVEELKQKIARISFIVKKKECLDLPEKTYEVESITMSDEQRALYKELRDRLYAELMSEPTTGVQGSISIRHTLTKLLRLAQVTSGFIPLDAELGIDGLPIDKGNREIKEFSPNPKLERCIELVGDITDPHDKAGAKTLIWCRFVHDIKAVERGLESAGIASVSFYGETKDEEREAAIRQYNDNDDIRVFVGQAQSGGLGLTLVGSETCPTSTEIFYSNDFNLELRMQAEDRAHRIGMHVPLTIVDLLCPGTIDQIMHQRLRDKRDIAEDFTNPQSIAAAFLCMDGSNGN